MGFNGFNLIMVRGLCFLHKLFSFPEDPCNWYRYSHFTIKVNHSCREIYHFSMDPIKEIHGLVFSMHVFKRNSVTQTLSLQLQINVSSIKKLIVTREFHLQNAAEHTKVSDCWSVSWLKFSTLAVFCVPP